VKLVSRNSTAKTGSSENEPRRMGLSRLAEVKLSPDRQQQLELAEVSSGGSADWRGRKRAELWDLLALSQLAPPGRMKLEFLDLRVALRAVVLLRVPVPCMPLPRGELLVATRALLGLTYPQESLSRPLPGYAFIQVLSPQRVWHANVAPEAAQPLCLGAQLPAGIRTKELVLMTYGALSMQSIMINERDPAGVLNPVAAEWWQRNITSIPLTRTPFLGEGSPSTAGSCAESGASETRSDSENPGFGSADGISQATKGTEGGQS